MKMFTSKIQLVMILQKIIKDNNSQFKNLDLREKGWEKKKKAT